MLSLHGLNTCTYLSAEQSFLVFPSDVVPMRRLNPLVYKASFHLLFLQHPTTLSYLAQLAVQLARVDQEVGGIA